MRPAHRAIAPSMTPLDEVLRFDPDNDQARAMEAEMARTNGVYRAR